MTISAWIRRLGGLVFRRRMEADLHTEIETHLALATDEYMREGMSQEEARKAARRSFGAEETIRDTIRDGRSVAVVDSVLRDVHLALRALIRDPKYTFFTTVTLATGIAAVTTVSAFVHEILLRPLPFSGAEELTMIWTAIPSQKIDRDGSAYPTIQEWKQRNQCFSDLALVSRAENATLTEGSSPEPIRIGRVSANLFSLLGMEPMLGRVFSQIEEDRRERVAVLSYSFWKSHFAGSTHVQGQTIRTEEGPLQVVGVMPPEFRFPSKEIRFWVPHTLPSYWPRVKISRASDLYKVVGRLLPGARWSDAEAQMNGLARQLSKEHADIPEGTEVRVVPLAEQLTGTTIPVALWLLAGAVFGVLLIACANVAALLLARGLTRRKEFAIRTAIGAGRLRLIQQLLIESLVIALLSAVLGVAAGYLMIRFVQFFLPLDVPHIAQFELSLPVALFSFLFALSTVVMSGVVPALRLSETAPGVSLRSAATAGVSGSRMRRALIAGQLAIATSLLAGTGLLLRSFANVQETSAGFETSHVLAVRVSLPASYDTDRGAFYFAQAMERLSALPGVLRVGGIHELFFEYNPDTVIVIEGRPPARPEEPIPQLIGDAVIGDYFQTMGVPLLEGRLLDRRDIASAPTVSMINQTMARTFFPGESAVGKRFTFGAGGPQSKWITIVGVVGDMHRRGLEVPVIPQIFGTRDQFPNNRMDLVIRTDLQPIHLKSAVHNTLRELDRTAVVSPPAVVADQLSAFNAWRRFQTGLLTAFAVVALAMAAMGIYGLLQQMVEQRRKEIGIRIALGARAGEVQMLILRQALRLVVAGMALGIVIVFAEARLLRSLLFGVSEGDPATIAGTVAVLLISGAAAAWLPSRKAAGMNPIAALRED